MGPIPPPSTIRRPGHPRQSLPQPLPVRRPLTDDENQSPPLTQRPRCHSQHPLAKTTQTPAPTRRLLHQHPTQVQDLVPQQIQQEPDFVVGANPGLRPRFRLGFRLQRLPPVVRLGPARGGQGRIEHVHELSHVAFRLPPLSILCQQLPSLVSFPAQARQQPEMIRIQLLRSLPHHQHHPARPIPTLRLIGQLMEPEPRWCIRGSPRRLGQVGLRHPVQDLILRIRAI